MSNSHDKIATRLAMIITKFNDGESFSAKELAVEFGVNLRTIQRDLGERLSFLPMVKKDGVYSLESYALGKLQYEDIRNFALLSGVSSLYPKLSDEFIVDLLNSKINKTYLVKNRVHEDINSSSKEFEEISVAVSTQRQIRFNYNDKSRLANPYKLINNNGVWYLLADEDGALKNYTLSKIQNLQTLDSEFAHKNEFLNTIKQNELNWLSQNEIEVELEIDNSIAEYFLSRRQFANQKILEHNASKLILSTKVSYDDEIIAIVKYWLPHIKILTPNHLQTKLENILKSYLKTT